MLLLSSAQEKAPQEDTDPLESDGTWQEVRIERISVAMSSRTSCCVLARAKAHNTPSRHAFMINEMTNRIGKMLEK